MDGSAGHSKGKGGAPASATLLTRTGSLADLYDRYWADLCRYVQSAFGSGPPEPEDVAQSAFAKLAALDKPENVKNPRAYLYRAAHNEAIEYRRREATRRRNANDVERFIVGGVADDLDAERVIIAKQHVRIIENAIKAMPQKKRQILLLSAFEGWSKAKISRRLGVSETQVKRLYRQAIAECRDLIDSANEAGTP